jgi:CBS domain-containing protein
VNVEAIMTRSPCFATGHATVADVARIMADHEVGLVPIIDASRIVIGVLTDRDICKAVATMNRPASEVPAMTLATKSVVTCGAEEDVQSALKAMRTRHIRRLPVVDKEGKLQGVLSMDDVILGAEEVIFGAPATIPFSDAVRTLKEIYANRPLRESTLIRP